MFIGGLFIIVKMEIIQYLPAGDWISRMCYIYSVAYFSAIYKNEQTIDVSNNMGESQKHYAK